jgi:hypothetical protein
MTAAPLRIALTAPTWDGADRLLAWTAGRPDMAIVSLDVAPLAPSDSLTRFIDWAERKAFAGRLAHASMPSADRPHPDNGQAIDLAVGLGGAQPSMAQIARARLGGLIVDLGAPGGFWDVATRQPYSAFAIRRAGAADAVMSGRIATGFSWSANRAALTAKADAALTMMLARIARDGAVPVPQPMIQAPRSNRPNADDLIRYGAQTATIIGHTLLGRLTGVTQRWRVGVARGDWRGANLAQAIEIENPPGHFLADPFVISRDGRDFVFVEDYDSTTKLGFLSVYELRGARAEKVGDVLHEPFHLSFPYLFEHDGRVLMVPETAGAREIRVYETDSFPLGWKPIATLMRDVAAVDTMVFERAGRWWMLTNIDSTNSGNYSAELHLFFADHPLSDNWTPHPLNPIRFDAACGRNGGLLRDGERLFRVAQRQGFQYYGAGATIFEIVTLSETAYAEREVATLSPGFHPQARGLHHMHSNGALTVFDFAVHEPMS